MRHAAGLPRQPLPRDDGVVELARHLQGNTTVRRVDLSDNDIREWAVRSSLCSPQEVRALRAAQRAKRRKVAPEKRGECAFLRT